MKLLIETGSESHTTSSAKMQVKFVGGAYDGQFLYQQKQFRVSTQWKEHGNHATWVETIYELPEGTEVAIIGHGETGPRGVNVSAFHCVYRLDASVEIQEFTVDVGLRECPVKGRLVLVRDVLAERQAAKQQARITDF